MRSEAWTNTGKNVTANVAWCLVSDTQAIQSSDWYKWQSAM